jgi:hypothetical protein
MSVIIMTVNVMFPGTLCSNPETAVPCPAAELASETIGGRARRAS